MQIYTLKEELHHGNDENDKKIQQTAYEPIKNSLKKSITILVVSIMKWEENLENKLEPINKNNPEEIQQLCFKAYSEGCERVKKLAIEAYRLLCSNLFGNRCLNHSRSKSYTQEICTGNCSYIKRYEFELYKLEN